MLSLLFLFIVVNKAESSYQITRTLLAK